MGRVASATFVGRAAELLRLDDALEAAIGGRTTAVLIGANAGVGKSRLLAAWNDRALARGARVIEGSCLDAGEAGPAYAAIAQALRRLFQTIPSAEVEALVGADQSAVLRILPDLPVDAGRLDGDQLLAPHAQTVVFQRLVDVLERAAAAAPLVLELEDLHWADPSTRAFLTFLVFGLTDARVLIVGTFRSEDVVRDHPLATTLRQISKRPGVGQIDLLPFDRSELREQLTAIAGDPPSQSTLDAIFERSEGNALFAEELLAVVDPDVDLPTTIGEALLARIADLSEQTRSVLRLAAVAGRTTTFAVLSQASQLGETGLTRALREAVAANILEADHAAEQYRFRHALLREAVYSDVVPGERRRMHGAVAQALMSTSSDPLAEAELATQLAHHWIVAGDDSRALDASLAAADLTAGQSAHVTAFRHYERALELWDRVPRSAHRKSHGEVLLRTAQSAYYAGLPRDAIGYGERALAELGGDPDTAALVDVLSSLWDASAHAGEDAVADAYRRRLAAVDPDGLPVIQRKIVLEARVREARRDGDFENARSMTREIEGLLVGVGDPSVLASVHLTIGWLRLTDLDVAGAIHESEIAAAYSAEAGDVEMALIARDLRYEASWVSGQHEATIVAARSYRELADRLGMPQWEGGWAILAEAESLYALGRLDECSAIVAEALRDPPGDRVLPLLHLQAATTELARGHVEDAGEHLASAYRSAAADDDEIRVAVGPLVEARLALADGRLDDCATRVASVLPLHAASDPHSMLAKNAWTLIMLGLDVQATVVERARAEGQPKPRGAAEAAADLTASLASIRRRQDEAGLPSDEFHTGDAAMIEGHLARIDDRDEPATWARAAEAYAPGSIEWLSARYRQAEAMLATSAPRDQMASIVVPAWRRAVAIGARPMVARFESIARRGRVSLKEAELVPPTTAESVGDVSADPGREALRTRGLSHREIDVLALVAAGYSNGQIADRLFISPKTASVHVSHIMDKLGASSRTEAATIAVRLGLEEVEPPDP